MDEPHLMQFTSRLSLAFMTYMLRQHSQELDVRIDCDQVLSAITFMHEGKRLSLAPWSDCPGWRPKDSESPVEGFPEYVGRELVEQDGVRGAAWTRWIAYATKTAQHIPRAVIKHQVHPNASNAMPKTHQTNVNEQLVNYYNDRSEQLLSVQNILPIYNTFRNCVGNRFT